MCAASITQCVMEEGPPTATPLCVRAPCVCPVQSKRATALHPYSADSSSAAAGTPGALEGLHGTAGSSSDPGGAARRADKCDSIYAAAVSPDGSLVVVGTTEGALRCIDTRTQQKAFKLKVGGGEGVEGGVWGVVPK